MKGFTTNEIITIVMEEINVIEMNEVYGIIEERNIPIQIREKIELLDDNNYPEFEKIIEEIAEEVYELKTGELNELNKCHEEIMILCEEKLKKYLC